jgi:hypothetical protein
MTVPPPSHDVMKPETLLDSIEHNLRFSKELLLWIKDKVSKLEN